MLTQGCGTDPAGPAGAGPLLHQKRRFNQKGCEVAIAHAHSVTNIMSGDTNAWKSK